MTSVLTDTHLRTMHGQPGTAVTVSFDASAQSAALTAGVTYLVQADQNCHIVVGSNPTATTSATPIAAWTPYLFTMLAANKIAAIKASTAGTLFITPLSGYRV